MLTTEQLQAYLKDAYSRRHLAFGFNLEAHALIREIRKLTQPAKQKSISHRKWLRASGRMNSIKDFGI